MGEKCIITLLVVGCLSAVFSIGMHAQQVPDIILHNGKIVTVDNHEVNADVGTIAQAIAIREDRIIAVGANVQVRALAGPNTNAIDLKGRTVMPGLIGTHDHPMDWDPLNPYVVKKVVSDDMHIERFLNDPPEQDLQQFPKVLDEAARKAKPGQWIRISLLFGPEYRWEKEITAFLGRQINKQMLDLAAPNNPVIVRAGFIGALLNQKAIETVKNRYGSELSKFRVDPLQGAEQRQGVCVTCYREVEQDVLYPHPVLKEIFRLGLSWMAGYGMTGNGTAFYTSGAVAAYHALDREGKLAMRIPWSWFWPERKDMFTDPYQIAALRGMEGHGSDYLWLNGVVPSNMGSGCTDLPRTKHPESYSYEFDYRGGPCNFEPGSLDSQLLYNYIKAGGRYAAAHTIGDKEIDRILDIIEQASKDAGMTLEEIRSKRHVYDHMGMNPRPDQIPRLKNLGIQTGGWDLYIWEGSPEQVLREYGEQAAQWVVPRKSLYDAGVRNSVEIDRALAATNMTFFTVLYSGITRKDMTGKVHAPQQAVSREAMLKSASLWGAYYAKRENKIGSLEVGKLADLIVLDRDYLTIPVDDILKIRVLATIVGGNIVHLVPSTAREWGMQPAGAQVELGGLAAQW